MDKRFLKAFFNPIYAVEGEVRAELPALVGFNPELENHDFLEVKSH